MVVRGRVVNGVVILEESVRLPEGAAVTVVLERDEQPKVSETAEEPFSDSKRRRILEVMDRIAALPIEGKTDEFSARDHDKILYGNP